MESRGTAVRRPAVASAALLLVGVGVTVWLLWPAGSFTLRGAMVLGDNATASTSEGECVGYAGFDDVAAGASVVVSDAGGAVVAAGQLEPAVSYVDGVCTFPFAVADVPAGSNFYRVEVSHRGSVVFGADEAGRGEVRVSLG